MKIESDRGERAIDRERDPFWYFRERALSFEDNRPFNTFHSLPSAIAWLAILSEMSRMTVSMQKRNSIHGSFYIVWPD
jgi:hypothetical protein